jgi:hypothetical protein
MDLPGSAAIEGALNRVGELLAAEGLEYAIVVLGGAALNLLGIIQRGTSDVDILAFATPQKGATGGPTGLTKPPEPMPRQFLLAIQTVARDLGLDQNWLNTDAALQWRVGLPLGLEPRVQWRTYGTLSVGLVSRYDLIFFKLFAAADSSGRNSVHYQDLIALNPSGTELESASAWVITQDASPAFAGTVKLVVRHAHKDLGLR